MKSVMGRSSYLPVDTVLAGGRQMAKDVIRSAATADAATALRSAVTTNTALSLSAEERAHNETVEGKWEQIQYYESRWNKQHQHQEQSEPGLDPAGGFNSLASSTAGSSTSSSSSTTSAGSIDPGPRTQNYYPIQDSEGGGRQHSNGGSSSKFQQMKRHSLKKLASWKSQLSSLAGSRSERGRHRGHTDYGAVSTAPDGHQVTPGGDAQPGGVIPRIRASKSMQNLEAITRDSYYGLREMKTSLKEKYNSRQELRQGRPKSHYYEFWDEYDPDTSDVNDGCQDEDTFNQIQKYHQKRRVLELIGLH